MSDLLNRTILLLASACALLVLASCDLSGPDEPLPFAWVRDGAELVYDFHPVSDSSTIENGRKYTLTLKVRHDEIFDDLIVDCHYTSIGDPGPVEEPNICALRLQRRHRGIYDQRPQSCVTLSLDEGRAEYLRVPSRPRVSDESDLYVCSEAERPIRISHVEALDQQVETPARTFSTFVLAIRASPSRMLLDREYWSEQYGLIRIETFDEGELVGYYELASKNF